MSEDYEVGYGRPPRHTQFPKGQSGNPRGRPTGVRNKGSVVREVIERRVTIRENGIQRTVTVFEALVEKLVSKALQGSVNDQIKLIKLFEKHAPEQFEDIDLVRPDLSALSDEDLAVLRTLAAEGKTV